MQFPCLKAVVFLGYGILFWTTVGNCQRCFKSSDCPKYATCWENTCVCREGYRPGAGSCFDIDECRDQNICNPNAICRNIPGSYSCDCKKGFQSVGIDGRQCVDLDECHGNQIVCDRGETCQNEQGGFKCFCRGDVCHANAYCNMADRGIQCECKPGFAGDGVHCEDVNECGNGTNYCLPPTICRNTVGSFECYHSNAVPFTLSYTFSLFIFYTIRYIF